MPKSVRPFKRLEDKWELGCRLLDMCPKSEERLRAGRVPDRVETSQYLEAFLKFCSFVVSWSRGVYGIIQNLEHAQKLVLSPDPA